VSEPDCSPEVRHAESLHAAIHSLGVPDGKKHAWLNGFVAVCEWTGEDGEVFLTQEASPRLRWWQRDGLMHAALVEAWDDEAED
jgi:hypothetical protein